MTLGAKLKQARLEAGLSQRQLCGDTITRNMLSQIENGTARPSMDTLQILAQRLETPVGYFLDEPVISPAHQRMAEARVAFARQDHEAALCCLEACPEEESIGCERWLLTALCRMALAEAAIDRGRLPYAIRLLEQAGDAGSRTPYWISPLERRRQLLLAQCLSDAPIPSADDRELLIRARRALDRQDFPLAARYLDAAEDHTASQWNYLRGQVFFAARQYESAVECLCHATEAAPRHCLTLLEQCYLALEDYKGAYDCARRLRELE